MQELLNSIKEFIETPSNIEDGEVGDKSLGSYLQQIVLLTDSDDDKENMDVVKLMTIHAAKGLEFPVVFVGGLEETLFPNAMSINTREELEEERRLFYGHNKGRKHLYLSYMNARYRFGQLQQNEPSRFIDEMPEEQIDRSYAGSAAKNNAQTGWGQGSAFERMNRGFNSNTAAPKRESKPAYASAPARPQVKNMFLPKILWQATSATCRPVKKVEHQKFGFGEVMKMEGAAHNPIATIQFELNGEKKIMLNYAKLRILE